MRAGGTERGRAWAVLLAVSCALSCAEDTILPVDSVCGDGMVEGAEECDADSPGCSACVVQTGWQCPDNECATTCGDGIVAGDEECDPSGGFDGIGCDSSCRTGTKAESCDMTGHWIVRQSDFSVDDFISQTQTSSNWFYFQIEQTGSDWTIVNSLACGIRVSGTVDVNLVESGLRALMYRNAQHGYDQHAPRVGTFAESGDRCEFTGGRYYFARGVETSLLPNDFAAETALTDLPPMPTESNPEEPTGTNLDGALDSDMDGQPGIAWHISGNSSGVRNTGQRDWSEWFSSDELFAPQGAIEFTVAGRFDNQEEILHVAGCPRLGCGVLTALSAPSGTLTSRVTFRYLGKTLDEPRAARIFTRPAGEDGDADAEACAMVRDELRHLDSAELVE